MSPLNRFANISGQYEAMNRFANISGQYEEINRFANLGERYEPMVNDFTTRYQYLSSIAEEVRPYGVNSIIIKCSDGRSVIFDGRTKMIV